MVLSRSGPTKDTLDSSSSLNLLGTALEDLHKVLPEGRLERVVRLSDLRHVSARRSPRSTQPWQRQAWSDMTRERDLTHLQHSADGRPGNACAKDRPLFLLPTVLRTVMSASSEIPS